MCRKGFLKLAMKYNAHVVSVYVFGASGYYKTSAAFLDVHLQLVQYAGISIPLNWGLLGSPFCPLPVPTTAVFGKPTRYAANQAAAPTSKELDAAHDQFCDALV